MANIQDTDTFLVNRSGTSYQIKAEDVVDKLQDDDLMLVNRDGVSYKATGEDIKDSLVPQLPPVINNVKVSELDTNLPRFTDQSFLSQTTMTLNGEPPSSKTIDAFVEGKLSSDFYTDAIDQIETTVGANGTAWTNTTEDFAVASYKLSVANGQLFCCRYESTSNTKFYK